MALLVFPLVTAAAQMVPTAIWVTTVTFGDLLRVIVAMPGAGGCIPIILMCTGTATMSRTGLVFVV